jgi:thymidylate synthase ThyX
MTFTFSSLLKFFELRCEPHAQAEIREYAWELLHTLLRLQECKTKPYTEEFAEEQGIDLTSPFWIPGLKEFYNSVLVKYDDDAEVIATSENSVE